MRIFSVVAVLLVMAISTMLQLVITLAQAELPLYLPYISPLYLTYISPISALYLPYISPSHRPSPRAR